jgi:hypothetical protein
MMMIFAIIIIGNERKAEEDSSIALIKIIKMRNKERAGWIYIDDECAEIKKQPTLGLH